MAFCGRNYKYGVHFSGEFVSCRGRNNLAGSSPPCQSYVRRLLKYTCMTSFGLVLQPGLHYNE